MRFNRWMCLLTFAAVMTFGRVAVADLLLNPSFEDPEQTSTGIPNGFDDGWSGDFSTIDTAEFGVAPIDGIRMLQIHHTEPGGPAGSRTAQVIELVDLSAFASQIATGQLSVTATARFNRVPSPDSEALLRLATLDGGPSSYPGRIGSEPAIAINRLITDADVETWEIIETTIPIPTNTTYMAVQVGWNENVINNSSGIELEGHYVDDVTFQLNGIVPEPTSLQLIAIGALMIFGWTRRM